MTPRTFTKEEVRIALDVIKKGKEVLLKADGLAKGCFAESAYGNPCLYTDESAVRFCAIGACKRATGGLDEPLFKGEPFSDLAWAYLDRAARRRGKKGLGYNVVVFNDRKGRKKEEVVAMFDYAIAMAEKELAQ